METKFVLHKTTITNKHTVNKYNPFINLDEDEFNTEKIQFKKASDLDIIPQDIYDGSVNLVISDELDRIKLINPGFTKDGSKLIATKNLATQYYSNSLEENISLTRSVFKFPRIDLESVESGGELKGGNYIFYLKYADNEENESDFITESGVVSVFNGNIINNSVTSIKGTLSEELTDKKIVLTITNIDTTLPKIILYYSRSTSDLNGVKVNKFYKISEAYTTNNLNEKTIVINGLEELEEISSEELNIQYNIYNRSKTIEKVQNRLFIGNLNQDVLYNEELQNYILKGINTTCVQDDNVGYIDPNNYSDVDSNGCEYYNVKNIYYKLGYWPNEYYRLGIVLVYANGSKSSVYNIKGGYFLEDGSLVGGNNYGVLKIWKYDIYKGHKVTPIGFKFELTEELTSYLKSINISGIYFVRQTRIPISVAQGISMWTQYYNHLPLLYSEGNSLENIYQRWKGVQIDQLVWLSNSNWPYSYSYGSTGSYEVPVGHYLDAPIYFSHNALLCMDSVLNPQVQSLFSLNKFSLKPEYTISTSFVPSTYKNPEGTQGTSGFVDSCIYDINQRIDNPEINGSLIYIPYDTPLEYIYQPNLKVGFSSKAGVPETIKEFVFPFKNSDNDLRCYSVIRGNFLPYVGVLPEKITSSYDYEKASVFDKGSICLYTIKTSENNYPNQDTISLESIEIRKQDNSPYMMISNIYSLDDLNLSILSGNYSFPEPVYRGDCYTCTVTQRYLTNFCDPDVPINDTVVSSDSNYFGSKWIHKSTNINEYTLDKITATNWEDIDRANINAVQLGKWVTYKCISNYNLGLRSEDRQYSEEISKMGQCRSFYPLRGMDLSSHNKIPESEVLNLGYSTTLSNRKHFNTSNNIYNNNNNNNNRIAFSNISLSDSFKNGYRIFQGLSYQDIESEYGSITKLISLNNNLFCVFENGCAIIPINEKALMSTTEGQAIHIYGSGVLQEQNTIISPYFGSEWKDSIIKTPNAIYGVDVSAKKIWKYNNEGFTIISDLVIQRYLNESIDININDLFVIDGLVNVKTHYNRFKNDVIFTFYTAKKAWSICYNELLNKFVCKYTWIPKISENVDNVFYSFNRNTILASIWDQLDDPSTDLYLGTTTEENEILNSFTWTKDSNNKEYYIKGLDLTSVTLNSITFENGTDQNNYDSHNMDFAKLVSNEDNGSNNKLIVNWSEITKSIWVSFNFMYTNLSNTENLYKSIYFIINSKELLEDELDHYNEVFTYNLYKHNLVNDGCLPTKWYDTQEPFELEFVVNTPIGIHKVFDNLMLISNNVEPESLEFEIIGDVYDFVKEDLFQKDKISYPKILLTDKGTPKVYSTKVIYDKLLNEHHLLVHQDCLNVNTYGRRLGNIQYVEDKWNIVIQPIYLKETTSLSLKTTRIRDKFAKIRIKYNGEKQVVITSILTLLRMSYA